MIRLLRRWFRRPQTSRTEKIVSEVFAFFYVAVMGWLGSGSPGSAFYTSLQKSALTPPGWVFPVVWFTLYFCLMEAAFLVWNFYRSEGARMGFAWLYLINGFCIFLWGHLFFTLHRIGAALALAVFMLFLAQALMTTAFAAHPKAGRWLIPYALWLLFAVYLNGTLLALNPSL